MFCTKCGKQLHDGDAFCAHCGARVREDLVRGGVGNITKYEEVVFNPPFRAEAQRKTEELFKEMSKEPEAYSSEPKKERVHFDWNLDGFPTEDSRKNENFELNWDAVIEKKRASQPITVEKIMPESQTSELQPEVKTEEANAPAREAEADKPEAAPQAAEEMFAAPAKEEPLSIEDLERELFGAEEPIRAADEDKDVTIQYNRSDLAKNKEQKFYTYNAKRDAFQELLDRERERVEAMENQRKSQWEEITRTEVKPEYEPNKALDFEDVFVEPKLPLVPPVKEVAVVLPPLTAMIDADEEEVLTEIVSEEPAPDKEAQPFQDGSIVEGVEGDDAAEKTKLRYSDVFPVGTFDSGDDGNGDGGDADVPETKKEIDLAFDVEEDDDDEDDKKRRGNPVIKALIIILALIVAVELVVIGAKIIAPESEFSQAADKLMSKITALFEGEEDDETVPVNTKAAVIADYINGFDGERDNLGEIAHNEALAYDLSKTYAFDEIATSQKFEDAPLDPAANDSSNTYGNAIVKALIGYYNGWKDSNQDTTDLVGINKLEIGEIVTGASGYYVLNKVTYAGTDGKVVEKYETAFLTVTAEGAKVNEVKEETV